MNKKVKAALFAIGLLLASGGFTQMLQAKPKPETDKDKNKQIIITGMCVGKGKCGESASGSKLNGHWVEIRVQ
jgi:hypothetical protein